jgi:hypothetical protein
MNLELWQSINYAFQDIAVPQLCLVAGYAFFAKKYISIKYNPIIYYLMGNVIIELISKIIVRINESSLFFKYVSFLYVPFELLMLYWFLKNIFKGNKIIDYWIVLNFSFIILFLIFLLFNDDSDSKYASLATSILNVPLLLYCLYPLNERFRNKKLFRIPEVIFCFSFLMAYTVLIIVFFTLPKLTEYSYIMANQLLIFKIIINIIFYGLIGYGINEAKTI